MAARQLPVRRMRGPRQQAKAQRHDRDTERYGGDRGRGCRGVGRGDVRAGPAPVHVHPLLAGRARTRFGRRRRRADRGRQGPVAARGPGESAAPGDLAALPGRTRRASTDPGRPGQHPGRADPGGEAMTAVEAIGELFAGPGARDYLGEPVTIGTHMLQAGGLAEAAGADPPLVAAALLHDVGHLRQEPDSRHAEAGARWLSQWFGEAVTEPVRLHVAAKRYLCATEPGYLGLLSAESVRTLALQGGPMSPEQAAAFEALPFARDAVAVRRWDDEAKDPAVSPPPFAHFEALLRNLLSS